MPGTASGRVSLTPDLFEAAEVGRVCLLRFEVGKDGIATNGGLLVDFPKAWFATLAPLSKPFQIRQSGRPHTSPVSKTSRAESQPQLELQREGLQGKRERYPHIFQITVTGSAVSRGG